MIESSINFVARRCFLMRSKERVFSKEKQERERECRRNRNGRKRKKVFFLIQPVLFYGEIFFRYAIVLSRPRELLSYCSKSIKKKKLELKRLSEVFLGVNSGFFLQNREIASLLVML